MVAEKMDLARRAVACPGWRLMPGMLLVGAAKDMRPMRLVEASRAFLDLIPSEAWLPDLDDPATRGCLLELVREAWGDPKAHVAPVSERGRKFWRFQAEERTRIGTRVYQREGATEIEALVVALEAAGR